MNFVEPTRQEVFGMLFGDRVEVTPAEEPDLSNGYVATT